MSPHRIVLAVVAVMSLVLRPANAVVATDGDRGAWLQEQLASAVDGATIDVPPGRYTGPFTIGRAITLRGHGRAVLVGDRRTHVVAIRAAGVTLDGFEVRGSGLDLALDQAAVHVTGAGAVIRANRILDSLHGIYVRHADGVRIEQNTILGMAQSAGSVQAMTSGPKPGDGELCATPLNQNRSGNGVHIWNSTGHVIARNTIRDTRDGIYFSFVSGSQVLDNDIARVRYGLHYMYSDRNTFAGNLFHDNAAGAALMFSKGLTLTHNRFAANRSHRAYGLLLQSVDDTLVASNDIAGNTLGVFLEGGNANRVLDNRITGNHVGIRVSDSSDANVFAGNRFIGNIHPVETTGVNGSNRWALDGRGNEWEGAVRLDLDRNGIADLPHRELDLFADLRRTFPAIGLLAGSPGERLLRFVHARIALPGASGIVDPSPLVTGASR
ncbi:MAG TPA: NosD domain-containing protein [Vicinamibacterales bacterium]|nr:NosD domain-containing protein [Vicinamibacterales bacterium]